MSPLWCHSRVSALHSVNNWDVMNKGLPFTQKAAVTMGKRELSVRAKLSQNSVKHDTAQQETRHQASSLIFVWGGLWLPEFSTAFQSVLVASTTKGPSTTKEVIDHIHGRWEVPSSNLQHFQLDGLRGKGGGEPWIAVASLQVGLRADLAQSAASLQAPVLRHKRVVSKDGQHHGRGSVLGGAADPLDFTPKQVIEFYSLFQYCVHLLLISLPDLYTTFPCKIQPKANDNHFKTLKP